MAEESATLKGLKVRRGQIKASVTRLHSYLDDLNSENINSIDLNNRKERLIQNWEKFEDIQIQIDILINNEEESSAVRTEFENHYYSVLTRIEELIASNSEQYRLPQNARLDTDHHSSNSTSQNSLRLPKVDLPTFTGAYENWPRFRDTFESLIHLNSKLPDIQKFHYLLSSLKNDAAELIDSVEISAANYEDAWTLLKERYDNKRLIVNENIKAIFDLPSLVKENYADLRQLTSGLRKRLSALKRLSRPTDQWDDIIIHIVTSKIDRQTDKDWEETLEKGELPTLKELLNFLDHKCETLESVSRKSRGTSMLSKQGHSQPVNSTHQNSFKKRTTSHVTTNQFTCFLCKGNHPIYQCDNFIKLPVDQRLVQVKKSKLCMNCLRSSSHQGKTCPYGSCKRCHGKHNTLLHFQSSGEEQGIANEDVAIQEQSNISASTSANCTFQQQGQSQILLSTAIINIFDKRGIPHECRALLDSGSQSNFITEDLANKLGLRKRPIHLSITGIGTTQSHARNLVEVRIKSRYNAFKSDLDCIILPRITDDLPARSTIPNDFKIPTSITLADPKFYCSSKIDLLIGAEIFWDLICAGQIKATIILRCKRRTSAG